MSIDIGFFSSIILFLFIVLPGISFRRGYYHGVHTRQFKFNGQGLLTIAYTLVLGLALNFVFIEVNNLLQSEKIDVNFELNNYRELLQFDDKEKGSKAYGFFNGFYDKCRQGYWSYLLGIYAFSIITGFFLSRLVLLLGLDLSINILRFNNDWQYIFDGRKLDGNKNVFARRKHSRDIKYVFVDILTNNGGERGQLYRGLLKSYDIDDKDPSKLSSISITKAQRWRKYMDENNVEQSGPTEIPGDLFTILGDQILNINCHYLKRSKEERTDRNATFKLIFILVIAIMSIALFVMITFKIGISFLPYGDEIAKHGILFRFIAAYFSTSILSLLTPFDLKESELVFNKTNLWIHAVMTIITGFILWLFW